MIPYFLYPAVVISLLGLSISCATTKDAPYRVAFEQDVTVISGNDPEQKLKKGAAVDVGDGPLTITQEGYSSVILLPLPETPGTVTLRLPKAAEEKGRETARFDANHLAKNILLIQNTILVGRTADALTRIDSLVDQFPGLSYVRFLKASAYLADGQVAKARETCESALAEFPGDEVGQEFLKQISRVGTPLDGNLKNPVPAEVLP